MRIELETPSGLVLRTRLTKDEYVRLGLGPDSEVSFQIREYRVLSKDGGNLLPEVATLHAAPTFAEGI
jgi:hypothetical protein